MKWHPKQVLATIQWMSALCQKKVTTKAKTKGAAKDMESNRRPKERVQAVQSLMDHVVAVASLDTKQVTVRAMTVHLRTQKAKARIRKARTARTSKALDDAGQAQEPENRR